MNWTQKSGSKDAWKICIALKHETEILRIVEGCGLLRASSLPHSWVWRVYRMGMVTIFGNDCHGSHCFWGEALPWDSPLPEGPPETSPGVVSQRESLWLETLALLCVWFSQLPVAPHLPYTPESSLFAQVPGRRVFHFKRRRSATSQITQQVE